MPKYCKGKCAEKSHTKTKPVIAKNALAVSFLALRVLMQVEEIVQNKSNLALYFRLIQTRYKYSD